MRTFGKFTLVSLILPLQVISTSNSNSVKTHVSATGDSQVEVESSVESSSSTKSEVSVESTVESSNGEVYKKIEIDVDGERKVLETTEPGLHELVVEKSSSKGDGIAVAQEKKEKPHEVQYSSLRAFILEKITKILRSFLGSL